jgi:hypothetical protein
MDIKYPHYGFKQFTKVFENLRNIIESASGPCFTSDQMDGIEKFAHHICCYQDYVNSYFKHPMLPKLQEFWKFRQAIISSGKVMNIILWRIDKVGNSQNALNELKRSIERDSRVLTITENIVNSIPPERPVSILSISGILLALIIRVETHEYEIENMIKHAKKYVNPFSYDIREMLTINSKVLKGKEWKTDTRAIRDAVSHANFTINSHDGVSEVHFNNTEKGYSFKKIFTAEQVMFFYQDYYRLMVIQTLLLNSALLTDLLIRKFKI